MTKYAHIAIAAVGIVLALIAFNFITADVPDDYIMSNGHASEFLVIEALNPLNDSHIKFVSASQNNQVLQIQTTYEIGVDPSSQFPVLEICDTARYAVLYPETTYIAVTDSMGRLIADNDTITRGCEIK